jgi:hypothetical protein
MKKERQQTSRGCSIKCSILPFSRESEESCRNEENTPEGSVGTTGEKTSFAVLADMTSVATAFAATAVVRPCEQRGV